MSDGYCSVDDFIGWLIRYAGQMQNNKMFEGIVVRTLLLNAALHIGQIINEFKTLRVKNNDLRSLLEECKPYICEGSRSRLGDGVNEEHERWKAAHDLLKRIERA